MWISFLASRREAIPLDHERRGSRQLELRAANGDLVRVLTPLTFNLAKLVDADGEEGIASVTGGPDPRETHLHAWPSRGRAGEDHRGSWRSFRHLLQGPPTFLHSYELLDGRVGMR